MGKVEVTKALVCGKTLYYPHNDTAKIVCRLAKQKTLTDQDIQYLKMLGFEVLAITVREAL